MGINIILIAILFGCIEIAVIVASLEILGISHIVKHFVKKNKNEGCKCSKEVKGIEDKH